MSDIFSWLKGKKNIDDATRAEIEQEFGARGKKALAAIDDGDVKRYRDFFVVTGKTGEYVVEEGICTCRDFIYRNRECWHILAVRIADCCGTYARVDAWYQEQLTERTRTNRIKSDSNQ